MRSLLRDLSRSHLFLTIVGLLAIWRVAAWLVPPEVLLEGINGMFIAMGIAIVFVYFRNALNQGLRPNHPSQQGVLFVAFVLSYASLSLARSQSTYARLMDYPLSWFNSDLWTFTQFIGVCGSICYLTGPQVDDGWVPLRAWGRIALILASGIVFVVAVYFLREVIRHPSLFLPVGEVV